MLFLISTSTSQNLKFIQKCSCLSSSKNKFQWTQNFFWPLIRKVLIWTFWDYKSLWSKKSTPIQPQGVIGAPYYVFSKDAILGSVPSISSEVLTPCIVYLCTDLWILCHPFKWVLKIKYVYFVSFDTDKILHFCRIGEHFRQKKTSWKLSIKDLR